MEIVSLLLLVFAVWELVGIERRLRRVEDLLTQHSLHQEQPAPDEPISK